MEYNFTLKKKEILLVIAWIALEGIIQSELSQAQEDKLHDSSHMHLKQ